MRLVPCALHLSPPPHKTPVLEFALASPGDATPGLRFTPIGSLHYAAVPCCSCLLPPASHLPAAWTLAVGSARMRCWVLVGLRLLWEAPVTSKKSKTKGSAKQADKNERLIANNRKARHNYEVLDTLECGIALVGSEVKSLRAGQVSLEEAYGRVERGEVWLVGCDIPEYQFANQLNHEPRRRRKLLLHRREIEKFASSAYEKNLTLVPLKMYFKRGRAKVLLGIGRGKKQYDKRESLKKKAMQRDIDRAMRR